MSDPLLPELKAAEARHLERQDELRRRGWGRTPPITRGDIANWTLDRWELKNGRNLWGYDDEDTPDTVRQAWMEKRRASRDH